MAAMQGRAGRDRRRQAGAGFGGCMVAFVKAPAVDSFASFVRDAYYQATGLVPEVDPVEAAAGAGVHLRPPAAPLVVHDPYFSIWSPADKLTDADTVHWTGKPQPLRCTVRVDGRSFRTIWAPTPGRWDRSLGPRVLRPEAINRARYTSAG